MPVARSRIARPGAQLTAGAIFRVKATAPGVTILDHVENALAKGIPGAVASLGPILRDFFRQTFDQGGRPAKWKPLAESTLAAKALEGASRGYPYATDRGRRRIRRLQQNGQRSTANILIATGALRDSAVQKGSAGHVSSADSFSAVEGTQHWLAGIHHFGGTRSYQITAKNGKLLRFMGSSGTYRFARSVMHPPLPARPIIVLEERDIARVTAIVQEAVTGGAS